MLFDRWRQRVLPQGHIGAIWRIRSNLCILRPTRVHNRNGKWIGLAVFAQLTAESTYILYNGRPYPPELPLPMGDLDIPCNTWCFRPMRAHNPNGTSIGSAVFAQMTAECLYMYCLRLFACFPSKLLLPMLASGPHVIRGSLGPRESGTQMVIWSFQPFLEGLLVWHTYRPTERATDRPRYSVRCGVIVRNYVTIRQSEQFRHY